MNILNYLEGRCEYASLHHGDRDAICAAMEGGWVYPADCEATNQWDAWFPQDPYNPEEELLYKIFGDYHRRVTWYRFDGTAALRLLERLKIRLRPSFPQYDEPKGLWRAWTRTSATYSYGDTPSAAIISEVCALARAQWPYKAAN